MSISKSEARRLVKQAAEVDAHVLRGVLQISQEGATLDTIDLLEWLARHNNEEIILVAAAVSDGKFQLDDIVRTCQQCGRDYKGDYCEYCADVRARLRGD